MKIVHGVIKAEHIPATTKYSIPIHRNSEVDLYGKKPNNYTGRFVSGIPVKLRKYLYKKHRKFVWELTRMNNEKRKKVELFNKNNIEKKEVEKRHFEFTFGIDSKSGISCVSVVHPKDQFSRKIGYSIVKGRILKQINLPKNCLTCFYNNCGDNQACGIYEKCHFDNEIRACGLYKPYILDYVEVAGK